MATKAVDFDDLLARKRILAADYVEATERDRKRITAELSDLDAQIDRMRQAEQWATDAEPELHRRAEERARKEAAQKKAARDQWASEVLGPNEYLVSGRPLLYAGKTYTPGEKIRPAGSKVSGLLTSRRIVAIPSAGLASLRAARSFIADGIKVRRGEMVPDEVSPTARARLVADEYAHHVEPEPEIVPLDDGGPGA